MIYKLKSIALLTAVFTPLYGLAQESLTDLWFIAPGNSYSIDTSNANAPLFTAQSGGTRVDGSGFGGDFSSYHIIFDNTYNTDGNRLLVRWGGNGSAAIPGSEVYNVGAITIKNYTSDNRQNFFADSAGFYRNTILNILGDFTIQDNNSSADFWIGENMKEVNVFGNLIIDNARVRFGADFQPNSLRNSTINGNVSLSGEQARFLSSVGTRDEMGSFASPDLHIKGIIDMQAGDSRWIYNSSNYAQIYSYIKVGGVNGSGKIASAGAGGSADASTSRAIIAFDTAAGKTWEFVGNINAESVGWNGNNTWLMHLDLGKHGQGTQILRLSTDTSGGMRAYFDGDITVKEGTLLFGNESDVRGYNPSAPNQKYNQLIMDGGNFGAVARNKPDSGELDIGDAYFNDIIWNSGKILVDINDGFFMDMIMASSLSADSAADVFEFVLNYADDWSDLKDVLDIRITDFFLTSTELTDDQMDKVLLTDAYGRYEGKFILDSGSYVLDYYQIPEPATIALIFGALALAFAAYRRKK